MTVLNRNPQNTNLLQATKFLLTFSRIPDVQYFCQTANLPGISLGEIARNTPTLDIYYPSTKLTFDAFKISFTIDEDLVGWKNLYDWFISIGNPQNLTSRQSNYKQNYSDATLVILSALNNPVARIQFFNIFPTDLSGIDFDTKSSADEILTSNVTFRYEYFNLLTV